MKQELRIRPIIKWIVHRTWCCMPLLFFLAGISHGQTITGKVTDMLTGESLPGVSILVKHSSAGSMTNLEGKYSISVNESDTLVFSSIGYFDREVIVGNRTKIDVSLERDAESLKEVVVVGYGTQSRRNVTGSVSQVDMKQVENLPTTNISQALRGRVAGVQFTDNGRPGQGGTILIRGQRSISAGNNPLIILDGIFFEGSLADINPADIASMEVLKDASATAIYGSRAANGVILITSKRGNTEKPLIRFGTYYGISDWSYTMKLLSPDRYIEKTLDWRRQSGLEADPTKVADYLPTTERENYLAGHTIDPWEIASQQGSIQNYNISVSGRTDRTNYFLSGNYNYDKGLVFNDQARRLSIRANLDNNITDWLRIGINAQFAERDLSAIPANLSAARQTSPFSSVWLDEAKTDPNPFPTEENVPSIIFNSIINKNETFERNLFANFYGVFDVPFVEGLSFRINYSPNYRWEEINNFSPVYQRNGRNDLGSASKYAGLTKAWVWENILTYKRRMGVDHDIDVTLLYGRNQTFRESLQGSGTDFSGTSDANSWNNLSLAKVQTTHTTASRVDAISSMARINYRFKNRYLITLTARRDGSSVFGVNNKYGMFPSAALAWVASEEPFMSNLADVDILKFRISYGSVGNQAISAYESLIRQGQDLYVFGDGGTTYIGLFPENLANPNLTWETTTTANFAVDFELWKGRLAATIEYYTMSTENLLLTRELPSPTGFSSILTNVGETRNKGVEITLNSINLQRNRFEWRTNLTFSTNKNKIIHLYQSDLNGDGIEDDDIGNKWFIGQPINIAYDYNVVGVYQETDEIPEGQKPGFLRLEDANGDGTINTDDRKVLGVMDPKYRIGITNSLSYGNFEFQLTINALQGWLGSNGLLSMDPSRGGAVTFVERSNFLDAGWWTPENRSNTRSSLVYTNPYGHGYYQSRNFVRIQEAALSYNFPDTFTNSIRINSLTVFLSGRNLYNFTKWQAMDPESDSTFPTPRTIIIGLNASF